MKSWDKKKLEEDLEYLKLIYEDMTANTPLAREEGVTKDYYSGLGSGRPIPSLPCAGRGIKDDSNVDSFRTTRLAEFTQLLSNFMRSKPFLSHLILTIS